jgi:hypothetical protein
MRLPRADEAIFDPSKLSDYCLSPTHPRGRHKARVFHQVLGVGQGDADWLRLSILDGIRDQDATLIAVDDYGTTWRVDVPVARQGRSAVVRTLRIVRRGEMTPRFITCWVQ